MSGVPVRIRTVYRRIAILPFLLLSARYHQSRSHRDLAKERLLRATMIVPTCFKAHLRLGAIYLEEQDFYRAKREFLLARELNPGKFRRLYPLITGQSGDININLFYFPGYTDREPDPAEAGNFLREFIGEPIDLEADGEVDPNDSDKLFELHTLVRSRVQALLDQAVDRAGTTGDDDPAVAAPGANS